MASEPGDSTDDQFHAILAASGIDLDAVARRFGLGQIDPGNVVCGFPAGTQGSTASEPFTLRHPRAELHIVTLRVSIESTIPEVWRRIEVRNDATASDLHEVLQAAMGWTDSHLHQFWMGDEWSGPHLLNHGTDEEADERSVAHEDDVVVDQLLRDPGDEINYTYDFGDKWTHLIVVEATRPGSGDEPLALCIDGERACPLEDSGGAPGQEEIVAALAQGGPLPEPWEGWVPATYDPAAFSIDGANALIDRIGPGHDEIMRRVAQAGVRLHPALQALLAQIDRPGLATVGTWCVRALDSVPDGDARELSEPQTEAAVHPWQFLLSMAGDDGIKLSQAGWMSPADVQKVIDELGIWVMTPSAAPRENSTPDVRNLRGLLQSQGLLRRYKGRLVRTPAGRAVDGDAEALWQHIASRLIPDAPGSFEQEATVLVLLSLAAGERFGFGADADLLAALERLDWHAEGRNDVGYVLLRQGVRPLLATMEWLVSSDRGRLLLDFTPDAAQRAMARAALFQPDA